MEGKRKGKAEGREREEEESKQTGPMDLADCLFLLLRLPLFSPHSSLVTRHSLLIIYLTIGPRFFTIVEV
jgi:hypothetical protein